MSAYLLQSGTSFILNFFCFDGKRKKLFKVHSVAFKHMHESKMF